MSITLENGQDPVAFILSANITAMVVAKARLLLSNKTQTEAAKHTGVSQTRVSQASVVLEYATDLVDAVLSGTMALNDAYEEAQKRKAAADSEEGKMERLRKHAIDLADLVAEERMSLVEGLAAARFSVRARA